MQLSKEKQARRSFYHALYGLVKPKACVSPHALLTLPKEKLERRSLYHAIYNAEVK
jgi:hypothetical protein